MLHYHLPACIFRAKASIRPRLHSPGLFVAYVLSGADPPHTSRPLSLALLDPYHFVCHQTLSPSVSFKVSISTPSLELYRLLHELLIIILIGEPNFNHVDYHRIC